MRIITTICSSERQWAFTTNNMLCPACHNDETKVLDSRVLDEGLSIRRRRACEKCGFRFSTVEEVKILNLTVVKNGGREQAYDRQKLTRGLDRALEKRPVSAEKLARTISLIERDIQLKAKQERIDSKEIGEIVMKYLKKLDKVAYIRFASVYHDFEDLETFKEELNKLINKKRKK